MEVCEVEEWRAEDFPTRKPIGGEVNVLAAEFELFPFSMPLPPDDS